MPNHAPTGKAAATLTLAAGILGKTAAGANERIRIGIMGVNGRGRAHVEAIHASPDAEVAALCDVDATRLEAVAAETEAKTGMKPRTFSDIREMIADDSIDAVTVAAPNHWHSLAGIWAVQAGKHVYIEKPICHTYEEGRRLVEIAQASGKVVQHGSQRRSDPHWQEMAKAAKDGIIGDIYMARCICFQTRPPVEDAGVEDPPPFLDWELWQGPATEKAFSRNYVHYNWHWFWHWGNAEVGNNVVHFTDIAHWIMDKGMPVEVFSEGGRYGYADAAETPNTQMMVNRFADGTMVVNEVRNRFSNSEGEVEVGISLYGADGYMVNGKFYDKRNREIRSYTAPGPKDGTVLHMQNFLDAIRINKPDHVAGPPEAGFHAAALFLLGNISHRVGRSLRFDPAAHRFEGADDANALLTREYREGFGLPG